MSITVFLFLFSGMHHNCSNNETNLVDNLIDNALNKFKEEESYPSPQNVIVNKYPAVSIDSLRLLKNGGWSDPRDHQLCLDIVKSSSSSENKCLKNHYEENMKIRNEQNSGI